MKKIFLIFLVVSTYSLQAQDSLYRAEIKSFIIDNPELLEYCHKYMPSNYLECKEFNWAKIKGSEFHYSGKTWGYSTYRRFREGTRMGKEGDYFDFAGGRLITLTFEVKPIDDLSKKKINLCTEHIYTMEGEVESKIRIVLIRSRIEGKEQMLKLKYPTLFQF